MQPVSFIKIFNHHRKNKLQYSLDTKFQHLKLIDVNAIIQSQRDKLRNRLSPNTVQLFVKQEILDSLKSTDSTVRNQGIQQLTEGLAAYMPAHVREMLKGKEFSFS